MMPRTVVMLMLIVTGLAHRVDAWRPGDSRSGVVLDAQTKKPIAGAKVKAECRKSEFHGSRVQRVLEALTNDKGAFAFEDAQLMGCDVLFVRAEHDGYVRTDQMDVRASVEAHDYAAIPAHLYLTATSKQGMQRLQFAYAMLPKNVIKNGKDSPEWLYRHVAGAFECSRRIAQTDEERDFIRDRYCPRFVAVEGKLDAGELDRDARLIPYNCGDVGLYQTIQVPAPNEMRQFCEGVHS